MLGEIAARPPEDAGWILKAAYAWIAADAQLMVTDAAPASTDAQPRMVLITVVFRISVWPAPAACPLVLNIDKPSMTISPGWDVTFSDGVVPAPVRDV